MSKNKRVIKDNSTGSYVSNETKDGITLVTNENYAKDFGLLAKLKSWSLGRKWNRELSVIKLRFLDAKKLEEIDNNIIDILKKVGDETSKYR